MISSQRSQLSFSLLVLIIVLLNFNGSLSIKFSNSKGYYMTEEYVTKFEGDGCDSKADICYWSLRRSSDQVKVFNYHMDFKSRTSSNAIQSVIAVKGSGDSADETYMDFRFVCHSGDKTNLCPTVSSKTYQVNSTFQLNAANFPDSAWNKVVEVVHYYYDNESFPMALFSYNAYIYDESDCSPSGMQIEIENELTSGYELLDQMRAENNLLTESFNHKMVSLVQIREQIKSLVNHYDTQMFMKCFRLKNELENYKTIYLPRARSLKSQVLQRNYQPIIELVNATIDKLQKGPSEHFNLAKDNHTIVDDHHLIQNADLFIQNLQTQSILLESFLSNDQDHRDEDQLSKAQMVVDLIMNLMEIIDDQNSAQSKDYDYSD